MKPRRCPIWVPALVLALTGIGLIICGGVRPRWATHSDLALCTLGGLLTGLIVLRRNGSAD